MADFQSSQTAEQIETVLVGAITPTRGRTLTETEKQAARDYIGATAFGDGIKVLAHFDTFDELVSVITKPAAGDSYSVGKQLPYRRYAYDFYHNEWRDYGPIRSEDISARLATNLLVLADEWIEDNTVFENYTFRARLPLGEITGNDFASVVFAPADAAGGNFCPVAFAFDSYVEIWANSRPEKEIIVKSVTFITITHGGEGNNTAGITNATGAFPSGGVNTDMIADGAITADKVKAEDRTQYLDAVVSVDGWTATAPFVLELDISQLNAESEPTVTLNPDYTGMPIEEIFNALTYTASTSRILFTSPNEVLANVPVTLSFSESFVNETLYAEDWAGSAPYSQTVEVKGLLEKDRAKVRFRVPGDFNLVEAQQEAFGLLYDAESADGSITLYAKELPETFFGVTLEVARI